MRDCAIACIAVSQPSTSQPQEHFYLTLRRDSGERTSPKPQHCCQPSEIPKTHRWIVLSLTIGRIELRISPGRGRFQDGTPHDRAADHDLSSAYEMHPLLASHRCSIRHARRFLQSAMLSWKTVEVPGTELQVWCPQPFDTGKETYCLARLVPL